MIPDRDELKAQVIAAVEAQRNELVDLSLRIHENPEEGFQEEKACGWLCAYLEERGFAVERPYCQLATAFRASSGDERPRVGFLAEYDALPGLGHACGHNLIAASSVGAAVAVRGVLAATGGSVVAIGTPAEEIYGGKAIMAGRGAFDDLDAAMLFHPGSRNAVITSALACIELDVEYFGRESHASTRPEAGINALDALIISFTAINALRQQIKDSDRIHGIITDGGQAPNVIPAHSAASFLIRAKDEPYSGGPQAEGALLLPGGRSGDRRPTGVSLGRRSVRPLASQHSFGRSLRRQPGTAGPPSGRGLDLARTGQHRHGERERRRAGDPSQHRRRAAGCRYSHGRSSPNLPRPKKGTAASSTRRRRSP